jgi:phosphatidylserine decarboxylase
MRIAPEGYALVVGAFVVAAVIVILTSVYGPAWLKAVGYVLGALSVGFVLWFFRDPVRTPPVDADLLLLAPADGKVIEIVEEDEPLYIKGKATRISIFLSPLNVHVNRSPATGTVEFDQYVPGDYLVAWHPKASELNERSQLGLRHAGSGEPVLFKQIAGAVARRIVYHVGVGDELSAGERFGIVKFGSRMDIFVREGVEITTNIGDRVTAGETIIGSFPAGS